MSLDNDNVGINHYSISSILHSTMRAGITPQFGGFDRLRVTHDMLRNRINITEPPLLFGDRSADQLIIDAFEQTREDRSIDHLLADPAHANRFYKACRRLGLRAPQGQGAIFRRLLSMRKHKPTGLKILPTSQRSAIKDFDCLAHAAEFAMMQVRYCMGATCDDILADPEAGKQFDELAKRISPGWEPVDYRLAALRIRKARHCPETSLSLFGKMHLRLITRRWINAGTIPTPRLGGVPEGAGIFTLTESDNDDRVLYVRSTNALSRVLSQVIKPTLFEALSGPYWQPRPDAIAVKFIPFEKKQPLPDYGLRLWELKLILEKVPVFNLPVHTKVA